MKQRFGPESFTATEFTTADEKAKFVNEAIRFFTAECPRSLFTKLLYKHFSLHAGHIAHFNRDGFYDVWFESAGKRFEFVERIVNPIAWMSFAPGWRDVERALQIWFREADLLQKLQLQAYHAENAAVMGMARSAFRALTPELRQHLIVELQQEAPTASGARSAEPARDPEQASLFSAA